MRAHKRKSQIETPEACATATQHWFFASYNFAVERTVDKERAPGNRTIQLDETEMPRLRARLLNLKSPAASEDILNRTINQDILSAATFLPTNFVDLLFVDPPYNLPKRYNAARFKRMAEDNYAEWTEQWLTKLLPLLKRTASVYICADWTSLAVIQSIAAKYLILRNRITWEREKGRGSGKNWKNCSEDILFCTVSGTYTFNSEAIKLRRRVIAPYRRPDGQPKDWEQRGDGNFRLTHASNLWTDLTVSFWSMPENSDHPTQKPEKLLARVILASSNRDDVVFDPFLGSGTTSVSAKKLGRRFVGVEMDTSYCCLAEKRLRLAEINPAIQGYEHGVFWERNSIPNAAKTFRGKSGVMAVVAEQDDLFARSE